MNEKEEDTRIQESSIDFETMRLMHRTTRTTSKHYDGFLPIVAQPSLVARAGFGFQSPIFNSLTESLGDISHFSLDEGLTPKDNLVFSSREEVDDIIETFGSEDGDVNAASVGAEITTDNPRAESKMPLKNKKGSTDWDAMFRQAFLQRHSSTAVATNSCNLSRSIDGKSLGTAFPVSNTNCTDIFGPHPSPHSRTRESFGLLPISDLDWMVNETATTESENYLDNASKIDLSVGHSGPWFTSPSTGQFHVRAEPPMNFYDVRRKMSGQKGMEEERKAVALEDVRSSLESIPTHMRQCTSTTSKRRRKDLPVCKEYADEITDCDVLMGRGGRSNRHPGNHFYLAKISETKPQYAKAALKSEKTRVAQSVVDYIKEERNGRFLELDKETGRWFVACNTTARTKAGQALRDQNTPEARAKKREKYGC